MDVHIAIVIEADSQAGDLTDLEVPDLVAKAVTAKLAGEIDLASTKVKVAGVYGVYENWPPKA
jgi:hypothetical protein